MTSFVSRDKFEITGRGTVYVVDLPDELWNAPTAPKLVDEHVWIDGDRYRVRGVEMSGIPWRPGSKALRTVGLLVAAAALTEGGPND